MSSPLIGIEKTMRALAVSRYCMPEHYQILDLPVPTITQPDEVLIKVHAASVNPVDVKLAFGMAKMLKTETFPYIIGYDVSGIILSVGNSVTHLKPGDEIYSRVPEKYRGTIAQYCLSVESASALKPTNLSFSEAASVPLAGLTALQAIERADRELAPDKSKGGLKGKTVLIPAGLSGTGMFAVQIAKNCFEAERVITTLSTGKIAKAKELMGEETFEAVDYTKENVGRSVGSGTVDFLFDTMASTTALLSTLKRGGTIVSVSTLPSGKLMKIRMPEMNGFLVKIMDFLNWGLTWWIGREGVSYSYMFMTPSRENLEEFKVWFEEEKIKTLVGRTAKLEDLEGVKKGCEEIFAGKGGVGKFVIQID